MFFDLGGTLLEYLPNHQTWDQLEARGVAALYPLLQEHGCEIELENLQKDMFRRIDQAWRRGIDGVSSHTISDVIQAHCDELGLSLLDGSLSRAAELYCQAAASVVEPYPGAAEVLAELKARGLKVGLISNTLWSAETHRRDLERFGLLEYFDDMVFSSEVGHWKPNPQVFNLALERLGLGAESAAFIGDKLVDDVGGALSAGLHGILRELDRPDTDYERGRQMGILPHARVRHLAELPEVIERLNG
jgi:putative hydrolase of the HAD superfamily